MICGAGIGAAVGGFWGDPRKRPGNQLLCFGRDAQRAGQCSGHPTTGTVAGAVCGGGRRCLGLRAFHRVVWVEPSDGPWGKLLLAFMVVAAAFTLASSLALITPPAGLRWLQPVGDTLIAVLGDHDARWAVGRARRRLVRPPARHRRRPGGSGHAADPGPVPILLAPAPGADLAGQPSWASGGAVLPVVWATRGSRPVGDRAAERVRGVRPGLTALDLCRRSRANAIETDLFDEIEALLTT